MTVDKHSDIHRPFLPEGQPPQHPPQQPQYVIVLPPYPAPHHRHRLFRKSWQRCLFCFATFLLFLIAAAYLLWPSHPELSVVRFRLDHLHINTRPKVSIDVTLDLTVRIRNRDFYSLNYDSLLVAIGYRGKQLGYVTSDGGNIKAREASYVNATLQLERVEVLTDVVLLLEDLAKGAITLDTESEIGGKLDVFFFDLPLKTKMKCEVVVNTKIQMISSQSCYPEAIPIEASNDKHGPAMYYLVVTCSALVWQCFFLGAVGVVHYSSLLSGIIIAVALPITEVIAVIIYDEKFNPKRACLFSFLFGVLRPTLGEIQPKKKNKGTSNDPVSSSKVEV